ncbi:MAG: AraC family transcriptional regulator [Tannerellaceae bacterium]|jgi:AraC-like DNA-binding protein/tetratricopeptide (TPR) repeat protein|nr:AraC family transcriptional regulator [Tannerellaceae bacterium]
MRIIILSFLLLPCVAAAQTSDFQYQKDSLQQAAGRQEGREKLETLTALHFLVYSYEENLDTLVCFFDAFAREAHAQNALKEEGMCYVNLLAAYINFGEIQMAVNRSDKILEFLSAGELWAYYYKAFSFLTDAYLALGQPQKALDNANLLYTDARERNNANGLSAAYYCLGYVYNKTNRTTEAEEFFRKCIDTEKTLKEKSTLATMAYWYLFEILQYNKRYGEAWDIMPAWEKAVVEYEKQNKLTNVTARTEIYTAFALLHFFKDDYGQAQIYCDSAQAICNNASLQANICYTKAMILEEEGQYAAALHNLGVAMDIYESYEEWAVSVELLNLKIKILLAQDGNQEVFPLIQLIMQRKDSLSQKEFHARLDELRTRYEVDKHIAEKERSRQNFLFALSGCMLLAAVLGIWMYYSRKVAAKNRTLAQQIRELTAQQELHNTELLNKKTFIDDEFLSSIRDSDDDFCPESRKDKLCIEIRDLILRDKAYRNHAFSRDYVIERLGTNRELFVEAFMYCFGMSFPEYINSLRLKDAITLLEQSDLSIEAISEKTGFGAVRTLQRQFRAKYNMSPKDYRNSAKGNR